MSEVAALEKWAGFTSTPELLKDAFDAEVQRWRGEKALTLLVFAVVPAVVEEFFFRGFLFNALLRYLPEAALGRAGHRTLVRPTRSRTPPSLARSVASANSRSAAVPTSTALVR